MYNNGFDEYIRSVLGYQNRSSYNDYYNFDNESYNNQIYDRQNTYSRDINLELENCYPEIYKIVYPMIQKRTSNIDTIPSSNEIEDMTNEIYFALEDENYIKLNINLNNDVRTVGKDTAKVVDKKAEVTIREAESNKRMENRQINRNLRDLIKILIIRELLQRQVRPQIPRSPFSENRPNMRPMMSPNFPFMGNSKFNPNNLFNREFETNNYDIFE